MKIFETSNGLRMGSVAATSSRFGTFVGTVVDISSGVVDGKGFYSGRVLVTISVNGKAVTDFAENFSSHALE